ncbi:hypothetical protein BV898_16132 [Hypsibius exemplaris]|uniref:Uncharacterized protein n=1 Tax=Hypsibius exemplaris TaxID=2072580 RepID=A0A9X6NCN4_HYPEX|nr:hypothetical protein BV898_16132 [Hypsibius exemplaris]
MHVEIGASKGQPISLNFRSEKPSVGLLMDIDGSFIDVLTPSMRCRSCESNYRYNTFRDKQMGLYYLYHERKAHLGNSTKPLLKQHRHFECRCRPGYRLPYFQPGPFQGEMIERATEAEYNAKFECEKIRNIRVVTQLTQLEDIFARQRDGYLGPRGGERPYSIYKKNACNTRCSQAVTHLSTNRARRSLSSEIERDREHST